MVHTLASEFGFGEEYILWGIPLSRAYEYHHAILRSKGLETYFVAEKEEKLEAVLTQVSTLLGEIDKED